MSGDGGSSRRAMYFAIVVRETRTPSFASSPWMRGAPHRTFSWLIRRMSARISAAMAGRPGRFRPRHHRRWCRPPCRHQRRTVSGGTILRASCQRDRDHTVDHRTHRHRSTSEHGGRLADRAKTANRLAEQQHPRLHDVPACTWVEKKSSDFNGDELLVRTALSR
jgi:hypothetical protein